MVRDDGERVKRPSAVLSREEQRCRLLRCARNEESVL